MQHDDLAEGRKARSTDDLEAIEQELESGKPPLRAACRARKAVWLRRRLRGRRPCRCVPRSGRRRHHRGRTDHEPLDRGYFKGHRADPAEVVFVLPNNKNIIMAAQAASELATREVVVVPTKTVPQGITAMLSFDETQSASENAELMTESLSGVTTMQITYAARNSDFEGRDIHEGEYLALYNGALLGNSPDLDSLLATMAEKAAGEGKKSSSTSSTARIPLPSRPRTRPKSSPKPFPLPKSMSSPAASPSTITSSPPNNRPSIKPLRRFPRVSDFSYVPGIFVHFLVMRRGGRLCPPKGSYEFAADFRISVVQFAGRKAASAPTVLWTSPGKFVGVDAHIDPAVNRFHENPMRIRWCPHGAMWASPPTRSLVNQTSIKIPMQFAASGFSFGDLNLCKPPPGGDFSAEAGDLEVFERIDVSIAVAVTVRAARTVGAAAGAGLAVL